MLIKANISNKNVSCNTDQTMKLIIKTKMMKTRKRVTLITTTTTMKTTRISSRRIQNRPSFPKTNTNKIRKVHTTTLRHFLHRRRRRLRRHPLRPRLRFHHLTILTASKKTPHTPPKRTWNYFNAYFPIKSSTFWRSFCKTVPTI